MKVKELLFVSVMSLICTTTLLFPIFFRDKLLFGGDTLAYDYPQLVFYTHQLTYSESPTWNPYYFAGYPTIYSPVGDFIDPLVPVLIRLFHNGPMALHVRIVISLALAFLFAYIFGRIKGLRRSSSFFLGVTYVISQSIYDYSSGLINSGVLFVLPALLCCVAVMSRGNKKSYPLAVLCGGLLLGYGWLAGFIQIVMYSAMIAGLYALYLDFPEVQNWKSSFFSMLKSTVGLFGAGVLSACVAYPKLIGVFALRPLTLRVSGFGTQDIDGISPGHLIHFFFPDYIHIPFFTPEAANAFYIGIFAATLLFLFPFLYWKDRHARFFFLTYVFIILLLIPQLGISRVLQSMPVLSLFHTLQRLLVPAGFCIAFVSALVFDRLQIDIHEISSDVRIRISRYLSIFLYAATCTIVLFIACISILPLQDESFRSEILRYLLDTQRATNQHYLSIFGRAIDSLRSTFTFSNWRVALSVLLIPLSTIIVALRLRGRMHGERFAHLGIAFCVLTALLVYVGQYDRMISGSILRDVPLVAHDFTEDPSDYYVLTFLTGDALYRDVSSERNVSPDESYRLQKETLSSDMNVQYFIPKVDGYEPFMTSRQSTYWRQRVMNENLMGGLDHDSVLEEKKRVFIAQLPVLSEYNVRYVVSGYELSAPSLRLVSVERPRPELPLYVYKNILAQSRVHVPDRVKVVQKWDASDFQDMEKGTVVIECAKCALGSGRQKHSIPVVDVARAGRVDFSVSLNEPTWVMIAQSDIPGWIASIDGKQSEIHTASYLMQALYVPAGTHSINMHYSTVTSP